MPLALIQQPNTVLPNAKSFPIRFIFLTNDHILVEGNKAFFEINFQSAGASNGQEVVIKDITFQVNNAISHSDSTFSTTGTARDVAINFAAMLKKNYEFKDFVITVTQSTSPLGWVVRVESVESEPQTDWIFDLSGLTLVTTFNEMQGVKPVLKSFKIWYQVFNDFGPVTEDRFCDVPFLPEFPFISVATVDTTERLAGIVKTTYPDIFQTLPVVDESFLLDCFLKFGGVEFDVNCNKIYGDAFQTAKFSVLNSVCQLEETNLLSRFSPNGANTVRFLTNRRKKRAICGDSYEWIHIYLESNPIKNPPFTLRIRYYNAAGDILATDTQPILYQEKGGYRKVFIFAIGTANPRIKATKPSGTVRYDIQVMAERLDEGGVTTVPVAYSELIERNLVSCNCKVAEMYFLEDKGSWQTVTFEHLQQRAIVQQGTGYERVIDYSPSQALGGRLYLEGGTYEQSRDAQKTFTLQTERITEYNRTLYEELLRSPMVLLRTTSDYGEVIRRVLFNRENTAVVNRGEATRLNLTFRFSSKLNTQ